MKRAIAAFALLLSLALVARAQDPGPDSEHGRFTFKQVSDGLLRLDTSSGAVALWGGANVPSQMPNPASRLYAQNVFNVIMLMTRDGTFAPDFDDEVVAGMCVTRNGEVLRQ